MRQVVEWIALLCCLHGISVMCCWTACMCSAGIQYVDVVTSMPFQQLAQHSSSMSRHCLLRTMRCPRNSSAVMLHGRASERVSTSWPSCMRHILMAPSAEPLSVTFPLVARDVTFSGAWAAHMHKLNNQVSMSKQKHAVYALLKHAAGILSWLAHVQLTSCRVVSSMVVHQHVEYHAKPQLCKAALTKVASKQEHIAWRLLLARQQCVQNAATLLLHEHQLSRLPRHKLEGLPALGNRSGQHRHVWIRTEQKLEAGEACDRAICGADVQVPQDACAIHISSMLGAAGVKPAQVQQSTVPLSGGAAV